MTTYQYATMDVAAVRDITNVPTEPDSYLAMDQLTRTYQDLIQKGFRWIRTDGDVAVFERKVKPEPRLVAHKIDVVG